MDKSLKFLASILCYNQVISCGELIMRRIDLKLIILVLIFGYLASYPQVTKHGDEVIRVDTQLVDVPVAVYSPAGIPVGGLKLSNFTVYEDGKKQDISDFSTTAEPFEVALLLDTSGSTRADLQLIQNSALSFVTSLRPGDRVGLIGFKSDQRDGQTIAVSQLLSGLTDDRTRLKTAIQNVRMSFGTPYYDSMLAAAESMFREQPQEQFRGRRALVALTDGVDSTSIAEFEEIKEALQKKGIICFFIKVDTREFFEEGLLGDCQSATRFSAAQIRRYYRSIKAAKTTEKATTFCGLGDFERLAVSKQLYEIADAEMNELAKASGGKVFPVADLSQARSAFKSVADEIGTKYTLSYEPTNDKRDGTFRKIRIDLVGLPKGSTVRAREGYTAPSN